MPIGSPKEPLWERWKLSFGPASCWGAGSSNDKSGLAARRRMGFRGPRKHTDPTRWLLDYCGIYNADLKNTRVSVVFFRGTGKH